MSKISISNKQAKNIIIDTVEGRRRHATRNSLPLALFALGIDPREFARIRSELAAVTVRRPKAEVPHGDHDHWH
jgi:hypothetical protein